MEAIFEYLEENKKALIRGGIVLAVLILFYYVIKFGSKAIKKFFGFDTGAKDNVLVLGDDFELPEDSKLSEMTINSLVAALSDELRKNYYLGWSNAAARCEILKKVNSLSEVDLRVIVFAYNKATARHLRNDLSSLTITGTCNDDSDGDVHKDSLIERIDRL